VVLDIQQVGHPMMTRGKAEGYKWYTKRNDIDVDAADGRWKTN